MTRLMTTMTATMAAEAMQVVKDLRWMIVCIAVLIVTDLWFGVSESRKRKVPIRLSRAGRRTCNKLIDYFAYLFFGAIMGMAIFEPLGIANHTTTAAAGLSLACVWEMDSIVNHVLALHGYAGRFSLMRLATGFLKRKDNALGEALEESLKENRNENRKEDHEENAKENRGKQESGGEQGQGPGRRMTVRINPKRSLGRSMIVFYNCLQSFAFYKASFACF